MNSKTAPLLMIFILFCSACGGNVVPAASTSDFFTATLPPTSTLQATQTAAPGSPTSIPVEEVDMVTVEGMTTAQVNVRAGPSTASTSLGMIGIFVKVQIAGRDASGSWYQILYAESETGKGWVRAEYVQVNSGAEIRPVEVSPASGGGATVSGMVTQKVNVRSGAGVEYGLIGVLNPNDLVVITGRNAAGKWVQIEFADSPDGKGWVTMEFLQAVDLEGVPLIGAEEQTPEPSIELAATVMPQEIPSLTAVQDGDSMLAPLAMAAFSVIGSRAMQLQGDVSAPNGDAEDWVQFKPNGRDVAVEATCPGGAMRVELWDAGISVKSFPCGERVAVDALADGDIFIRLIQSEAGYTGYVLNLEVLP